MAQSALRALTQQLMQGGPAPSGMASYQTAVQNATNRPQNSADMLAGLSQFTSLDTPQNMSLGATAADIGMGFLPGVGTAQGMRDFERARRDDDMLGMALGGLSAIPFAGGIVKAGKGIGRAAEGALDMSQAARMQRAANNVIATETPEFKSWFGESAVRNAEDVPRVVYHGTMTPGIEVFDRKASLSRGDGRRPSIDQIGLWTSSIAGDVQTGGAARYGKTVMPLYAKIESPLELSSHTELEKMWRDFHNSDKEMRLAGMSPERIEEARKLSKMGPLFGDPDGFRQSLINVGYDGVIIPEWRGDFLEGDAPQDLFIALDPTTQIKSATTNSGAFDPRNPAISAGIMGGAVGLSALRQQREEKRNK